MKKSAKGAAKSATASSPLKPSKGVSRGSYAEPGEDPKSVTAPKGARKR